MGWRLWTTDCYRAVDTHTLGIWKITEDFAASRDYCLSQGGDLVSIHSAFENAFIQSNLSLNTGSRYWIGLRIYNGKIFSWADGSNYTYTNLDLNSLGQSNQTAYLSPNAKWMAFDPATKIEGLICKKPALPNMPAIHNGSALGDSGAHDPTILKTQDGQYIVSSSSISPISGGWFPKYDCLISNDRQNFLINGTQLPEYPWWSPYNDNRSTIWAPDTSYHNGQYYMYYAVSTGGSEHSAIGLATSPSGRPGTWTDQGMVFNSSSKDACNCNAIDPNLLVDDDGSWYLIYGSFWTGLWQWEMDPSTGKIKAGTQQKHLAQRFENNGALEGSGMFKKGGYYYLIASIDNCCRKLNSTYRTVVWRSTSPSGPFVDKQGKPSLQGGGTELLVTDFPIIGPGGPYVYLDTDHDLIVYHYYDGLNEGRPRLGINYLGWTDDKWPYIY